MLAVYTLNIVHLHQQHMAQYGTLPVGVYITKKTNYAMQFFMHVIFFKCVARVKVANYNFFLYHTHVHGMLALQGMSHQLMFKVSLS